MGRYSCVLHADNNLFKSNRYVPSANSFAFNYDELYKQALTYKNPLPNFLNYQVCSETRQRLYLDVNNSRGIYLYIKNYPTTESYDRRVPFNALQASFLICTKLKVYVIFIYFLYLSARYFLYLLARYF